MNKAYDVTSNTIVTIQDTINRSHELRCHNYPDCKVRMFYRGASGSNRNPNFFSQKHSTHLEIYNHKKKLIPVV